MRQIWISRHGGPEVLLKKESPDPTPKAGEVLIDVRASGVNFADVLARLGKYPDAPPPPCVPGFETAGFVLSVGNEVTSFKPGDRVLAAPFFGGYTDRLVAREEHVVALPDEVCFESATALPVQYATAYQLVHVTARLSKAETVFIHSAAGGVGLALVDLCRQVGARIFGAAGTEKHAFLRDRGVERLLDSRNDNFFGELVKLGETEKIDVIFDSLGGESWEAGLRTLAPLGKLCAFGNASVLKEDGFAVAPDSNTFGAAGWYRADTFRLVAENKGIFGVNLATLRKKVSPLIYREWLERLLQWQVQKQISPVLTEAFPLEKAQDAHRFLQSRKSIGKIVLTDKLR